MGHTPGPWSLWHDGRGAFVVTIDSPDGWTICSRNQIDHRAAESIANAHMIAAAPDMLRALTDIRKYFEREFHEGDKAYQAAIIARYAIAKAEGLS